MPPVFGCTRLAPVGSVGRSVAWGIEKPKLLDAALPSFALAFPPAVAAPNNSVFPEVVGQGYSGGPAPLCRTRRRGSEAPPRDCSRLAFVVEGA